MTDKQAEEYQLNFSHASKSGFKKWLIISLGLAAFSVLQFLVASFVAMQHFPEGYSMTDNFVSDLGRSSHSYSDFFNFSLMFMGVGLIPMFLTLILVDPRESFSMKLATGFGIVSALGLIGMGMTPVDKFIVTHHIALAFWLFPMFYMLIVFYYSATHSRFIGIGFLFTSLVMVVVMLTVLMRANVSSYQVMQKLIVAFGLVWLVFIMAFIAQSSRSIIKVMKEPDYSREEAEESYFTQMYREKAARQKRV